MQASIVFYVTAAVILFAFSILCGTLRSINKLKYDLILMRVHFVISVIVLLIIIIFKIPQIGQVPYLLSKTSFIEYIAEIFVGASVVLGILSPFIHKTECNFCGKRVYLRALFSSRCPHCGELLCKDRFTK